MLHTKERKTATKAHTKIGVIMQIMNVAGAKWSRLCCGTHLDQRMFGAGNSLVERCFICHFVPAPHIGERDEDREADHIIIVAAAGSFWSPSPHGSRKGRTLSFLTAVLSPTPTRAAREGG